MLERLEAVVCGRVQGVSFRYYTLLEARSLGVAGWVANRADGSVQVVAEGERPALDSLAQFLQRGSPAADVEEVRTHFGPATSEFKQFAVRG